MKLFALSALFALLPVLAIQTAQAQTPPVSAPANEAKNLARANCGAHLTWISPNQITAADQDETATDLLLDDNTFNRDLTIGQHSLIVSLADVSNLSRFTFINEQAKMRGTVQLFVSNFRLAPNDTGWIASKPKFSFGSQRFVSLPLTATEGKYVKVLLDISKPGTIAGIGLYGQTSLASFTYQSQSRVSNAQTGTVAKGANPENLNFNFANVYAHARIRSVSSGVPDLAARMIDDDAGTSYAFSPNDTRPTVVIELSSSERLRRVSVVYDAEPGAMEVFLLNKQPEPGALDNLKPVMTVQDQAGAGKAVAEFNPLGARWVALRWNPADQHQHQRSFTVAEIGAFSDALPPILESLAIPPQMAQSTAVTGLPPAPPVIVPTSQ